MTGVGGSRCPPPSGASWPRIGSTGTICPIRNPTSTADVSPTRGGACSEAPRRSMEWSIFRGHPLDYDGWAAGGLSGWSYAEVLPYFKRAEQHLLGPDAYHGASGPLAVFAPDLNSAPLAQSFVQAACEAGYGLSSDANGERQEGFGPCSIAPPATAASGAARHGRIWGPRGGARISRF